MQTSTILIIPKIQISVHFFDISDGQLWRVAHVATPTKSQAGDIFLRAEGYRDDVITRNWSPHSGIRRGRPTGRPATR